MLPYHFYNNEYKIFNPAQPLEEKETEKEIELSKLFYDWLHSKNINLFVLKKDGTNIINYTHSSIPRIIIGN